MRLATVISTTEKRMSRGAQASCATDHGYQYHRKGNVQGEHKQTVRLATVISTTEKGMSRGAHRLVVGLATVISTTEKGMSRGAQASCATGHGY